MHIKDMLSDAETAGYPSFSFEFFPPKTAQGVQNLYDRMDRMHGLGPSFIDITWGAGGTLAELTLEMVSVAQSQYGLETCMHLTVRLRRNMRGEGSRRCISIALPCCEIHLHLFIPY